MESYITRMTGSSLSFPVAWSFSSPSVLSEASECWALIKERLSAYLLSSADSYLPGRAWAAGQAGSQHSSLVISGCRLGLRTAGDSYSFVQNKCWPPLVAIPLLSLQGLALYTCLLINYTINPTDVQLHKVNIWYWGGGIFFVYTLSMYLLSASLYCQYLSDRPSTPERGLFVHPGTVPGSSPYKQAFHSVR